LEISIIEFAVYGFISYASILILLVSTLIKGDESRLSSLIRTVIFIPSIITVGILAQASPTITLDTVHTLTITNDTINTVFYEDTVTTDFITLLNPVWGLVHLILFFVLIFYVFKQVLLMLGIGKESNIR
jgi:hypothetical protein